MQEEIIISLVDKRRHEAACRDAVRIVSKAYAALSTQGSGIEPQIYEKLSLAGKGKLFDRVRILVSMIPDGEKYGGERYTKLSEAESVVRVFEAYLDSMGDVIQALGRRISDSTGSTQNFIELHKELSELHARLIQVERTLTVLYLDASGEMRQQLAHSEDVINQYTQKLRVRKKGFFARLFGR